MFFSKARTNNADDIYNSKYNKADQFRVWEDIDEKFEENETKSFTNSIEEIYKKRRNNVEEIIKPFLFKGVMVLVLYLKSFSLFLNLVLGHTRFCHLIF